MDSEEWIKRRTSWWKWSEERWTSIWKVEHWRMRTSQSATTAVSWCQIRAACHERAAHGHDKRMLNHQEEVGSWRSRKKGHKMRPVKCHGSVMTLKVASELKSNVEIPPPTMRWITRSFSFPIPSDSVDYYSRCLWAIHCGWLMRCNSATVEWHSRIIKDVLFHFDNHLRGFFFWVIISVSLSIPMGKWPQRFLLSQMWKEEFWFFCPPKLLIFSSPSRKVF